MPTLFADPDSHPYPFPLTRARLLGWVQAPRVRHAHPVHSSAAASQIEPPPALALARHAPSLARDTPAHPVGVLSRNILRGKGPLAQLMRENALYPVFQPIASLGNGSIHAHEALIRGPQSTPLHTPDALLDAARREDLLLDFELFCVIAAVHRWGSFNEPGRLFVNISAAALVQAVTQREGSSDHIDFIRQAGVMPRMLVLELTEHERVTDMGALAEAAAEVRAAGVSLALDDFGDGRSSLRLWSQIKPEIVKIDKYFTKNISNHAENLQTLQAIKQIAAIFGSELVAEGIETQEDLRVLRDLNIAYGQGYFLGRPALLPRAEVEPAASVALRDRSVAVFPELERAARGGHLRGLSVMAAPVATLQTSNDAMAVIFMSHPELHAAAVVDDSRPVAIINRQQFMNDYAKLYFREVSGRKPCVTLANHAPRLIELNHNIDELVGILTSQDQRYLRDGFIVTDNGRYVGLGTGDQLVRSVTEARIESARHANPLTFLPGNIPISQHIERLLASGVDFVACYADLNNFKPFNDHYGYWRGDEMIRLVAKLAVMHCDPQRDFVGHVGGDDFLILFQSQDWQARCQRIISEFRSFALELYDAPAREAGGIHGEDRHGDIRFFPCTTLSIGTVQIRGGQYRKADEVATQAALAKHEAKKAGEGVFILGSSVHLGA